MQDSFLPGRNISNAANVQVAYGGLSVNEL